MAVTMTEGLGPQGPAVSLLPLLCSRIASRLRALALSLGSSPSSPLTTCVTLGKSLHHASVSPIIKWVRGRIGSIDSVRCLHNARHMVSPSSCYYYLLLLLFSSHVFCPQGGPCLGLCFPTHGPSLGLCHLKPTSHAQVHLSQPRLLCVPMAIPHP